MRLNRFFTVQGICSRREADRLIKAGRVRVNGVVAKLGTVVEEGDSVELDNKGVSTKKIKPVVLCYYKPIGVECTENREVRNNIFSQLNYPERVFYIGRLDKNSEGLLLLTNMGDIVNKILKRTAKKEKEYEVAFETPIPDAAIDRLARGVTLTDGKTAPCKVTRLTPSKVRIILTEGRNRQIRRMAEAVMLKVQNLKRTRVMHLTLGNLKPGQWKKLPQSELTDLLKSLQS